MGNKQTLIDDEYRTIESQSLLEGMDDELKTRPKILKFEISQLGKEIHFSVYATNQMFTFNTDEYRARMIVEKYFVPVLTFDATCFLKFVPNLNNRNLYQLIIFGNNQAISGKIAEQLLDYKGVIDSVIVIGYHSDEYAKKLQQNFAKVTVR